MGRLIPDLLRAVADGWEQAAGRDPVDQHAAEAVELLDLDQTATNVRVGPVHVYRLWPDGVSDEDKVAILERELLRVALERDRLAEGAFGPIPATTDSDADAPDLDDDPLCDECIAHWSEPADDPSEVVVTADVDEDLVIQLGLDLQEARREIERLTVVVDAARAYADLYAGARAKYCVEPSSRALVDAVRALDGQPLLSARTPAAEGTA